MVRKRENPIAQNGAQIQESERKVEYFEEGTQEFNEAISKIPQTLLALFYEQLRIKPQRFARGAFVEEIAVNLDSSSEDGEEQEYIDEYATNDEDESL